MFYSYLYKMLSFNCYRSVVLGHVCLTLLRWVIIVTMAMQSFFYLLSATSTKKTFLQDFSSDSNLKVSELLKNLEEMFHQYYTHSNMFSSFT